jgi:phosphohistidine phosphatase
MKSLTLLRHAKSSWNDTVQRDFDRPLNRRGRRAAALMGREMARLELGFDHVIASPAARIVETLDDVGAGYGARLPITYDQRVYLADPETLLELVRAAPRETERLLLVGHNPGLERLALLLAADGELRGALADKYPTATLAQIDFDVAAWGEVGPGSGRLVRFVRPRDLDPELGPEE